MLQQHHELAAHLHGARRVLVSAPHAKLHQLGRLDERLLANLDGLVVAGPSGLEICREGLASPFPGEVFAATVIALELRDAPFLDQLLALADSVPDAREGVLAAFGWVSPHQLRGITKPLLDSPEPQRRALALSICALHAVNPDGALALALTDTDPTLRATACRATGELGLSNQLPVLLRTLPDPSPDVRFEAARAAVRLGDRNDAMAALRGIALAPSAFREPALLTWLKLAPTDDARAVLRELAAHPDSTRLLVRGAGLSGDTFYVPWLLKQMAEQPALARLAGEAFAAITGADLSALDLDGNAPESFSSGPDDNPESTDVALDEDESLPWPDPARISAWWQQHGARWTPGVRHVAGAVPTPHHMLTVLQHGVQRQRQHAAEELVMLEPGSALFNTAAPTWRQERQLAAMQT